MTEKWSGFFKDLFRDMMDMMHMESETVISDGHFFFYVGVFFSEEVKELDYISKQVFVVLVASRS